MKKSESLPTLPDVITVDWAEVERRLRNGEGYKGPPITITLDLKEIMKEEAKEECVMIVPHPTKRKRHRAR